MAVKELSGIVSGKYIGNIQLGLWYDLNMLHPQDFGVAELNAEVDRIRPLIYKGGFNYLPTLGLLEKQWMNISNDYRKILASKTHVLLYKSGWLPDQEYPKLDEYTDVDIVCVPAGTGGEASWKCYTKWDDNAFAFRFVKLANPPTIDPPDEEPPVEEPPTEEPDETPPVLVGGAIHMICPHCKKLIF